MTSTSRKRKANPDKDVPAAKKPRLLPSYTRTDPKTGKIGRVRRKDDAYMEIFLTSKRAQKVKKQRERRAKREAERQKKLKEKRKKEREQRKKNREKAKKAAAAKAAKAAKKDKTAPIVVDDDDEDSDITSSDDDDDIKIAGSATDIVSTHLVPFHKFTKRFKDHVCVVTGGGRGIGRACALRIAQEGGIVYILDYKQWKDSIELIANAQTVFHENEFEENQAKLLYEFELNKNNNNNNNNNQKRFKLKKRIPKATTNVFHVKCNVTDENQVKKAISDIIKERGFIDVLLNCVNTTGTDYLVKNSHTVKLNNFKRIMELNVNSTFNACNAVIPYMLKEQYGRIVNLAAQDGKTGAKKCLAFAAAKAAVIALTKTYGKEYAGTGITVNCVAPHYDEYHVQKLDSKGHTTAKNLSSAVPMGRAVEMAELAGAVAFIASEENTYTTGFCYDLTGGTGTY